MSETQVQSLGQEDPLKEGMVIHASILAWRILDRGIWWATVHRVTKSQTWLKQLSMHILCWMVISPKEICVCLNLQNLWMFGKRVFVDISKNLEMRSYWIMISREPGVTRSWKRQRGLLPQNLWKEHNSAHLDFGIMASRMAREYTSLVLRNWVHNFLWQPQEMNTVD